MPESEQIKVIELRNYLIKPGLRDEFIAYFRRNFVRSQNALGGFVLGAFTIEDEPDRFFWIRGFSGMASRSGFLPRFYGGEVWNEFGTAANAMMLEWHNVHLLKPVRETRVKDFSAENRLVAIDFYFAAAGSIEKLTDSFITENAGNSSVWISERAENDFPRLPVIQDENLLATITTYENRAAFEAKKFYLPAETGNLLKKRERMVLSAAF